MSLVLSRRSVLSAAGLLGLGGALAACGSGSDPFDSTKGSAAPDGAIVVGSQQYYSNEIIAEIYAQALEGAGFTVERQFRIGQREVYLPEMVSGAIDVLPEYGGNLLQYYAEGASATDAASVHAELLKALPEGLTVLDPAEATDQDSYTVTRQSATTHNLASIADLSALGRTVTIAANSEFTTRPYGPDGLKAVYGVAGEVVPVEDSGGPLTVSALTGGDVDVADIYTANPAIEANDLVVLEDPESLILPQQVTPLVSTTLEATAAEALNRVSALLTSTELRALNARSTVEQLEAAVIATDWLTAMGVLG